MSRTYTSDQLAAQERDNPIDRAPSVRSKIAATVVRFCRARVGKTFHARELLSYVRVLTPDIAPESPARILRDLRKSGRVEYSLLSRQASTYTVMYVAPERA